MTEEKMREQLEHTLCKLEAQEACRNLMGRYSYYRTAFQSKEMVALWAKRDDDKLVTPWGSYQGHQGIEACYLKDIGDRSDAKVFEAIKGAVIMHEVDTEVIEVAEDLQTAKAAFLSQGHDTYIDRTDNEIVHAKWAWEKYSVDFIMEDGEWKIWHMTIYPLFQSEYGEGWADNKAYVSEAFAFPNAGPEKTDWHYDRNELYPANEPAIPEPYVTYDKSSAK